MFRARSSRDRETFPGSVAAHHPAPMEASPPGNTPSDAPGGAAGHAVDAEAVGIPGHAAPAHQAEAPEHLTPVEGSDTHPAEPEPSLDELLARLQEAVEPDARPGGAPPTNTLTEHADILRSTREAQHQAHEMLTVAAHVRAAAADQAEQVLREAHDSARRVTEEADRHAARVRREIADWANEQRSQVDAAVAELLAAAERDADVLRAEANRAAMAQAEQTARAYVGDVLARGTRDAEAIRAEARQLLERVTALVGEASGSVHDLAAATAGAMTTLHQHANALAGLIGEVGDSPVLDPASEPGAHTTVPSGTGHGDHSVDPLGGGHTEAAHGTARPLGSLFRAPTPADNPATGA